MEKVCIAHLEWMTVGLVRLPVLFLVLNTAVGHLVAVGALGLGGLLAHMAGIGTHGCHGETE